MNGKKYNNDNNIDEKTKNNKKKIKNKSKKNRKKNGANFFLFTLFIGMLIAAFPFFANYYNQIQYKKINLTFDRVSKDFSKDEINRRIQLAKYYNDFMIRPNVSDPFDKKHHEEGIKEYARMLQVRESIGYVEIPKINISVPIYAGTSEDVLQRGVGHMEYTSLPIGGKGTHCVLTGHSGLPTAKIFTDLNKMEVGDIFFVHNIKDVLAYKVDNIRVIEPTNFEPLKIDANKDYCTLLTCTPYMINTHRLLVRGIRTDYKQYKKQKAKEKNMKILVLALILLLIILLISIFIMIKRKRNKVIKN